MFEFEIDGIQFRINPKDPFGNGSELIIYLERLSGASWAAMAYPSIYKEDCTTKEATYAALKNAYTAISAELTKLFGKDTSVPESGFDLVRHLISKQTVVVDKQVVLTGL